jgi:uncharacterized protein YkwD
MAEAEAMLQLVNQARQVEGLAPLRLDPTLVQSATEWARKNAGGEAASAPGSDGNSPLAHDLSFSGYFAENVAMGSPSVQSWFNQYMNSPGHRANILNPRWSRFGSGSTGAFNTQRFG